MPTPIALTTFTGGSTTRIGFALVAPRTIKGVTRQNHVGDTVYVQDGAEKGSVYIFNEDGQWVKQGQSNTLETGFIQTFIGKSGDGSELPTYSSTDVVTQSANLETAIGQLDAAAGDTLAFIGKSIGEEMPLYATPIAVTQGASLNDGISQLDQEIGYLLSFIGKGVGNEAPAYLTTKVVGQGKPSVARGSRSSAGALCGSGRFWVFIRAASRICSGSFRTSSSQAA